MPSKQLNFKLDAFLPFRLVNVSEDMSQQLAERYRRKYNMTRPEWRTFAIIGEHEAITATEVGKISHMHKTKVSRAIGSLAERRWLSRTRDDDDRRIEHLKLTSRGRTHYGKLVLEANAFSADLETRLGADAMKTIWQAITHLDRLKT